MSTRLFSAANVADANRLLRDAAPQQILRWAVERFAPRLAMATAFGAEGCCLIHMLWNEQHARRTQFAQPRLEAHYPAASSLTFRWIASSGSAKSMGSP
jgi:3'-phosphoadenosine 5'-phosphosulfate sulfotransferase (PAPS reductase)/FAD synthetase